MDKILIIKLGALGDVVRTTPLLRQLKGHITWVTQKNAMPLLKGNPFIDKVVAIEKSATLLKQKYDLVLSLDEELPACRLASAVTSKQKIGTLLKDDVVIYTDSARSWFDMSLISRFGKKVSDQKKWANKKSYQDILFAMVGKKFKGEDYVLPAVAKQSLNGQIGLEMRSGERWVAKRWPRAEEFQSFLKQKDIPFYAFKQSATLMGYLKQIQSTEVVVTTDSLALHLALGLGKKVVALFTCTSPHEIYGYNRLAKVVSPLLKDYYYCTEKTMKPGQAISLEKVWRPLKKFI